MDKEALEKLLELDKDELVLWSGKPEPFIIMDRYYKPVFIRSYIISIAVIIMVFTAAFIYNAGAGGVNYMALGVLCAVPLVIIPAGLSQYSNYGKKCHYFFTNKNVIVNWESRLLKISLSNIGRFDAVPQFEGTVTIRIGKAAGIPVKKNRDYALKCFSESADGEENRDCLLYNLSEKDAGIVLELIDKYRVAA